MNILSELTSLIQSLGLPVETGEFGVPAPDAYIVLIPLTDEFRLHADNEPHYDEQFARIALFAKHNYLALT